MSQAAPSGPPPQSPLDRPAVRGVVVASTFLVASIAWRFLVECSVGVLVVLSLLARGGDPSALTEAELQQAMSAGLIATVSILQLIGLAALAGLAAWVAQFPFRKAFALGGAGVVAWFAAVFGGLVVGWFPGWLAEQIIRVAPWLSLGNLDMIADSLVEGPLLGRLLMVFAVAVAAPIAEELVFRGFLWDAFERALPTWAVWLLTSGLFALYHVDPVHVITVMFIGLFLGWMRWTSGSLWPAVAAHFCNNALGIVAVFALETHDDVSSPWWGAVLSVMLTLAVAAIAWFGRKKTG